MKHVNKILLIGRLGADPVFKETRNGYAMVQFSLATSRRVRAVEAPLAPETASPGDPSSLLGASEPELPDSAVQEPVADGAAQEGYVEETQWHRIVAWGREAEVCHQYLRKGSAVFVEGSLRSRRFTGKDGVDRTWFEVHADHVNFLGGPVQKAVA